MNLLSCLFIIHLVNIFVYRYFAQLSQGGAAEAVKCHTINCSCFMLTIILTKT